MHEMEITDTLDLHTIRPQEVEEVVEEYLYQCHSKKFRVVRLIHGKGIGVQRQTVRAVLSQSKYVESYSDGPDWGSTVAYLK
ncbi:MAG TPA: Smr/MutS family protein [Acidobacteriota bacterium]|nr:Smr/MutS family protein [Acidobacteriota bacterium]